MRWLGKAGADRDLINTLLAKRRLFLQPIRRAPPLITVNAVGFRVYGDEDWDPADGSHIKTLYGVFLFIPLIPFSSYLVLQSPQNPECVELHRQGPSQGTAMGLESRAGAGGALAGRWGRAACVSCRALQGG